MSQYKSNLSRHNSRKFCSKKALICSQREKGTGTLKADVIKHRQSHPNVQDVYKNSKQIGILKVIESIPRKKILLVSRKLRVLLLTMSVVLRPVLSRAPIPRWRMPKQHDADGDANGENIVKGCEIPDGFEDLTFLETFSLLPEESWSYLESCGGPDVKFHTQRPVLG